MTRRSAAFILLATLAWLLAAAFSFRISLLSGLDLLPGDELDSRLILHLHEHWFQFYSGQTTWKDLGMFYPVANSLGFSDTFFLSGTIHSVFRLAGLDIYQAGLAQLFALSLIGFTGFYHLGRRVFGFAPGIALFLAVMFLASSPANSALKYAHIQTYSIWLTPWVVYFALQFFRTIDGTLAQNLKWAAIASTAYAATLYNAFYLPWFLAIFALFSAGYALATSAFAHASRALAHRGKQSKTAALRQAFAPQPLHFSRAKRLAFASAFFAIAILPFILTYLPILQQSSGHGYNIVSQSLPTPSDLFNSSNDSLVWGPILYSLIDPYRLGTHGFGLPIASFILTLLAIAYLLTRKSAQHHGIVSPALVKALAAGVLLSWLFMLKFGEFSLWRLIYETIPGASAVRVVFRFNIALCLPILLIWGIAFQRIWPSLRPASPLPARLATAALALLAAFLLVEQTMQPRNPFDNPWALRASTIQNRLAQIPTQPDNAKVFFVRPYDQQLYTYDLRSQLDAWAIAQERGLKTLNGYSGILPPRFRLIGTEASSRPVEYDYALRSWIQDNRIQEPVYQLDLNTQAWSLFDNAARSANLPEYPTGATLQFRRDRFPENPYPLALSLDAGWSGPEPGGTWTDGPRVAFTVKLPPDAPSALTLALECYPFLCETQPSQYFRFLANGAFIGEATLRSSPTPDLLSFPFSADIADPDGLVQFTIECPDAIAPASVSSSGDKRQLGLTLLEIRIH